MNTRPWELWWRGQVFGICLVVAESFSFKTRVHYYYLLTAFCFYFFLTFSIIFWKAFKMWQAVSVLSSIAWLLQILTLNLQEITLIITVLSSVKCILWLDSFFIIHISSILDQELAIKIGIWRRRVTSAFTFHWWTRCKQNLLLML